METVTQITVLCVVSALLTLVIKRAAPEQGLLLTMAAAAVVLLCLADALRDVTAFLEELAARSGVEQALFVPLYKTIGIALVVKVGGSLCKDAGEAALSAVVESAGTVCALLAALPLLRSVLDMLLELMG